MTLEPPSGERMTSAPPSAGRMMPVADGGHFRIVHGRLGAGRVGAVLAGSAWLLLALGVMFGAANIGAGAAFVILSVIVFLGGVITEIVGWFGLRGLAAHRGWATTVGTMLIIECGWLVLGPLFVLMSFRDVLVFATATCALVVARAVVVAVGFWRRSGAPARVAAFAFSIAAASWIGLLVALIGDPIRADAFPFVMAATGALCEGIGHFGAGAYFIEQRPIPVDVSAFS